MKNKVNSYIKDPIVIEAIQWDGFNLERIFNFIGNKIEYDNLNSSLEIPTLEGTMICSRGDYIIKGIRGEVYPCKSDIFEQLYRPVRKDWGLYEK